MPERINPAEVEQWKIAITGVFGNLAKLANVKDVSQFSSAVNRMGPGQLEKLRENTKAVNILFIRLNEHDRQELLSTLTRLHEEPREFSIGIGEGEVRIEDIQGAFRQLAESSGLNNVEGFAASIADMRPGQIQRLVEQLLAVNDLFLANNDQGFRQRLLTSFMGSHDFHKESGLLDQIVPQKNKGRGNNEPPPAPTKYLNN